jgi:hypothetical protein
MSASAASWASVSEAKSPGVTTLRTLSPHQKDSTWCSLIVTGASQASEATLENAAMPASGAPF